MIFGLVCITTVPAPYRELVNSKKIQKKKNTFENEKMDSGFLKKKGPDHLLSGDDPF